VLGTARSYDYEVTLLYVGLDDPEECLRRIRERVRRGGHSVPEEDVRRRLIRSIANLSTAVQRADHVVIYDKGPQSEPYKEVVLFADGSGTAVGAVPPWAKAAAEVLARRR
jgi:predicted ABC-type ATPase